MDDETLKAKARKFLADADGKAHPGAFDYLRKWLNERGYEKATDVIPDQREEMLQHLAAYSDQPLGPVRTITRRELVPGTYGRIRVTANSSGESSADVAMVGRTTLWTAQELRDNAETMLEIADFLDGDDGL